MKKLIEILVAFFNNNDSFAFLKIFFKKAYTQS